MAQYDFADLVIELEPSVGAGTWTDISDDVETINGYTKQALIEEITSAGDSRDRHAFVGLITRQPVVLGCRLDDAANTPYSLTKNGEGETRGLRIAWDGSTGDRIAVDTIITRAGRTSGRGALSRYEIELQPTGTETLG